MFLNVLGDIMDDEHSSIGKIVFLFFCTLPYKLFCIVYFALTLPRRMRAIRKYHDAPKHVRIKRLSEKPVSALIAFDHVRAFQTLHTHEGGENRTMRRPSLFDLLEALWSEGISPDWKIPSLHELEQVQGEITKEIELSSLSGIARNNFSIWALDEDMHMFVAYFPFTKQVKSGELPEHIGISVIKGQAPDSRGSCYAYAVSVTLETRDQQPS